MALSSNHNQIDIFAGEGVQIVQANEGKCLVFGKYKGQPFEVLLQDPQYALYLMSSMLVKLQHNYPELLAFLVSRFGSPGRTPAHNLLQNRFLDESFALRFALAVSSNVRKIAGTLACVDVPAAWERYVRHAFAVGISEHQTGMPMRYREPNLKGLDEIRESLLYQAERISVTGARESIPVDGNLSQPVSVYGMEFEEKGADVRYAVGGSVRIYTVSLDQYRKPEELLVAQAGGHDDFRVEVKPIVGDDYPVVLRAMKAAGNKHLLVGEYAGTTATWDEMAKVFGMSRITVVSVDTVERTVVPSEFYYAPVKVLAPIDAIAMIEAEYARAGQRVKLMAHNALGLK